MPKITSEIWKYFTKADKQVECKTCGKKLTMCGNTTNYWNHLMIHNIKKTSSGTDKKEDSDVEASTSNEV